MLRLSIFFESMTLWYSSGAGCYLFVKLLDSEWRREVQIITCNYEGPKIYVEHAPIMASYSLDAN